MDDNQQLNPSLFMTANIRKVLKSFHQCKMLNFIQGLKTVIFCLKIGICPKMEKWNHNFLFVILQGRNSSRITAQGSPHKDPLETVKLLAGKDYSSCRGTG
jgi:hypothetical protein